MTRTASNKPTAEEHALAGGIEWIVARELAPVQRELARLRARVDAMRQAMEPW